MKRQNGFNHQDHLSLDREFTMEHYTEDEEAERAEKARITLVIAGRRAGLGSEEIRRSFEALGIEKEATNSEDHGQVEG